MRQQLPVIVAGVVVLLVGLLGYRVLFDDTEQRALVVSTVVGEVQRVDADGQAHPASVGEAVAADGSRVRVGAAGRAILSAGEGSSLLLEADTTVRVLEADRRGVTVELDEGRVQARVVDGASVLGVRAAGRTATVAGGAVRVGRDGQDTVRVAVDEGAVSLEGFGVAGLVAGERIDARAGDGGVVSEAVMEEILLEVRWPEPGPTDGSVPVDGRTHPHARVAIRGPGGTTELDADEDGRFKAEIDLPTGDHVVSVTADDGLAEPRATEQTLHRDAPAPTASTEVRWER